MTFGVNETVPRIFFICKKIFFLCKKINSITFGVKNERKILDDKLLRFPPVKVKAA
jgi:hypothetical protein